MARINDKIYISERILRMVQGLLSGALSGTLRGMALGIGIILKKGEKTSIGEINQLISLKNALIQSQIIKPLKNQNFKAQLDEPLVFQYSRRDCARLAATTFICGRWGLKFGVVNEQISNYELFTLAKEHYKILKDLAHKITNMDDMILQQYLSSYSPFSLQVFRDLAQHYMEQTYANRLKTTIEEMEKQTDKLSLQEIKDSKQKINQSCAEGMEFFTRGRGSTRKIVPVPKKRNQRKRSSNSRDDSTRNSFENVFV